jgi:hypothetical protein
MRHMLQLTSLLIHPGRFFWGPAIGLVAGVYCFCTGLGRWRRKRLILTTPASKVRSASMGLVEVSGRATSPYVMNSPLKRAECYYYRTLVWQWEQQGKTGVWLKTAEEILHVPFYVDDNTEKVLIDPRGAKMELQCDLREEYKRSWQARGEDLPPRITEFLIRHGIDPASKEIKVEEYCIKPGTFLFVLGTMSQNPGIDATVMPAWAERADRPTLKPEAKSDGPEIIRLSVDAVAVPATEMTQQQKIAAALMKARAMTAPSAPAKASQAPLQARNSPATVVAAPVLEESAPVDPKGFDLHPPIVLMKGTHEPAFFISWRSPREALKGFDWKGTLMLWGGSGLVLACLYLLLFAH